MWISLCKNRLRPCEKAVERCGHLCRIHSRQGSEPTSRQETRLLNAHESNQERRCWQTTVTSKRQHWENDGNRRQDGGQLNTKKDGSTPRISGARSGEVSGCSDAGVPIVGQKTKNARKAGVPCFTSGLNGQTKNVQLCSLQRADFSRLRTLGTILHFELDLLAFVQAAIATTLNSGEVSKNVTAASIGSNETEAFFGIEPLNFALLNHDMERPKNKSEIALHQERKTRTAYLAFSTELKRKYRFEACGTLVHNCTWEHTHRWGLAQLIVNPYVVFFPCN